MQKRHYYLLAGLSVVMIATTTISVFVAINAQEKMKISFLTMHHQSISSAHNMNLFQMTYLTDIAIEDNQGIQSLLSNNITTPSFILFLSENYCPSCLESIMMSYSVMTDSFPMIIVFNNISLRELHFRSSIIEETTCYSLIGEYPFDIPQALFFTDRSMYIYGALIPYNGIAQNEYSIFFSKCKNYETFPKIPYAIGVASADPQVHE